MESEVSLPYVFFTKSNHNEDSDTEQSRRRMGGSRQSTDAGRQITAKGDAESSSSSKGERPPIMTPDERAWNNRLIKSFHSRRSLIDALVLSPSGVVISTLGRQIEVNAKNMDPGRWISGLLTVLLGFNLLLFLVLLGSGFISIRIVKPFNRLIIADWLDKSSGLDVSGIDCSTTTTISLFVLKSRITFYMPLNRSSPVLSMNSKMRSNFVGLVEYVIFLATQLLTGQQVLTSSLRNGKHFFYLNKTRRIDITPVPHCFQDYDALREIWVSLHYQCLVYLALVVTQLYFTVTRAAFQRVPHFADPRDRTLTPEQMRTRITIGLEGVAALQRICFYTKLMLVLQALIIVLFQRIMQTIKYAEYSSRQMANLLQKSGLPKMDVDLCSHLFNIAVICGTLQSLAFFCLHSLARFYSAIASSKVPQVRLVPSQDESYVT